MKTLEELHTLVRLLKKFELPISPILEYAINEKEEELLKSSLEIATSLIKDDSVTIDTEDNSDKCLHEKNKEKAALRVYRGDGSVIQEQRASDTYSMTIKEIGPDRVMKLNIFMDGDNIVTKGGNSLYPTAQHNIGNGLFVNTHSNTKTKLRQLKQIFSALKISWTAEIVSVGSEAKTTSPTIELTREIIEAARTPNGGFTKNQLAALGILWPAPKDWIEEKVGMLITQEQLDEFNTIRYIKPPKK